MKNLKHIIVGFFTLLTIGLMVWIASDGGAYHGGAHGKVIQDFDASMDKATVSAPKDKDDRAKEMDKLGALRDKAGNVGAFKVSNAYKSKCASCHGINGSGFQNGRAMMGPKIFGPTSEEIYKMLIDFKDGRKENMIMKGLLINLSSEDLKMFADEIGEFPARAKASEK